jgi:hypothetical protein
MADRRQKTRIITLNPKWPETLEKAMSDPSPSICIVGPVGSGKSSFAVFKIIGLCHKFAKEFPKTRWCVVRNSYRELKDTTQKTYFYWFPPKGYGGETYWENKYGPGDWNFGEYRSSDEIFYYQANVNGQSIVAEILFRSAEDESDLKKFKSLEICGYHIDEAIEVPKEVKLMLDTRIGRYPRGWPRPLSLLTTNPPHERHWIYKDYFSEEKLEGHSGWKQKPGENEENLPVGYYDRLRANYRNNPDWINRYIEGNWGIILEGEKVYPEFHASFHSTTEELKPQKGLPIIRGYDFGLTPACVFSQLLPDGQWIIFDELQEFNMGIDRFTDKVLMHSRLHYQGFQFFDYADPQGWAPSETDERTCVQIMNSKGIYPQPGEKSFTARREAVASYLNRVIQGKPAFLISKTKCPILYDGLTGGYHYPKNKDGIVTRESPVKNEMSHLQDALQYVASRLLQFQNQWLATDWEPKDMAATYKVA